MMVLNQIGTENCYQFKNEDEKKNFIQMVRRTTKIIYRANPTQKNMFISALRESGQQCAIIGSNVNDIASLKSSTVSFCLGVNGCQVAKLSSDFIVQDNNFYSIKDSIRWGRNLLISVRRFVQFSLSAIIPCVILITLSGGIFS